MVNTCAEVCNTYITCTAKSAHHAYKCQLTNLQVPSLSLKLNVIKVFDNPKIKVGLVPNKAHYHSDIEQKGL